MNHLELRINGELIVENSGVSCASPEVECAVPHHVSGDSGSSEGSGLDLTEVNAMNNADLAGSADVRPEEHPGVSCASPGVECAVPHHVPKGASSSSSSSHATNPHRTIEYKYEWACNSCYSKMGGQNQTGICTDCGVGKIQCMATEARILGPPPVAPVLNDDRGPAYSGPLNCATRGCRRRHCAYGSQTGPPAYLACCCKNCEVGFRDSITGDPIHTDACNARWAKDKCAVPQCGHVRDLHNNKGFCCESCPLGRNYDPECAARQVEGKKFTRAHLEAEKQAGCAVRFHMKSDMISTKNPLGDEQLLLERGATMVTETRAVRSMANKSVRGARSSYQE